MLNGIQTQSASVYNLMGELDSMRETGVDMVRISPQAFHTAKILNCSAKCMDQRLPAQTGDAAMAKLMPDQACDGYWHGRPGIEQSHLASAEDAA